MRGPRISIERDGEGRPVLVADWRERAEEEIAVILCGTLVGMAMMAACAAVVLGAAAALGLAIWGDQ